jgi:hypothetical protein
MRERSKDTSRGILDANVTETGDQRSDMDLSNATCVIVRPCSKDLSSEISAAGAKLSGAFGAEQTGCPRAGRSSELELQR